MNEDRIMQTTFEAYDPKAHDLALHAYVQGKYGSPPPRPLWGLLATAGTVSIATLVGYGVYRAAVAFAAGIGWLGGER